MADISFEIDGHKYEQRYLPCELGFSVWGDLPEVAKGGTFDSAKAMKLAKIFAGHTLWINDQGIGVALDAIFDRHFATVKDLARLHVFIQTSIEKQFESFLSHPSIAAGQTRPTLTGDTGAS